MPPSRIIACLTCTTTLAIYSAFLRADPPPPATPVNPGQPLWKTSADQGFRYFSGNANHLGNNPAIFVGKSIGSQETLTVIGPGVLQEFPMSRFADAVARYRDLLEKQGYHPFQPAPLPLRNHPILGTWEWTDIGSQCGETRTFEPTGRSTGRSAEEIAVSHFEISATPSAKGYYRLADTIVEDNGKPDCAGHAAPVGDTALMFLRFDPGMNAYLLCRDEDPSSCLVSAKRVRSPRRP